MFNIKSLSKYSLVLAALVPAVLHAQTNVTVNATVSASVSTSSSGTTMTIPAIAPGSSDSVAAASGASVTATFNTSTVTFTMPSTVTLTRTASTETLTADVNCAILQGYTGSPVACGAASGGNYNQNAAYAASGGVGGTKLAQATVYAGAALTVGATARAGTYSGTFQITVSNSGT